MKETIIILGAGVMQGPVINIAKELGFFTIALDGSSSAPCVSMADQFEQIDLKDKESIEAFARSIQSKTSRLGIMTAGTDFSASVAWTAEKLGLPGIPYETALNASDKSRMRECFKKAALPSPEFFVVSKEEFNHGGHGGENFINTNMLSFPVVIKPVDNMGSRGCRKADNMKEFHEAAKTAIGFSRSGRAIVENFMDGPEFSVDAIVYHGEITICGLADRHIFFPPYFIEMGHTMPTIIEKEHSCAILETFCKGIHALGICGGENIGAAKGDIKLTSKGPMIGEIAARLSGGYMSGWTYPYSSGALPIKGAILAAMGKKPEGLIPIKKWTCAERAFISIPGTVKQIIGVKDQKLEFSGQGAENINNFFMRIKEGDKVSFPENNVTKCGNIIASAPDRETAVKAAENAARSILIRLDPSDPQTEIFLSASTTFPPDAFQLTDELREALAQLKEENMEDTKLHGVLGTNASFPPVYSVAKFPAFESSNLTDYMGRTVKETLDAVRILTGLPLPMLETSLQVGSENAENVVRLGKSFWAALIRGSYQGAVCYIDNLGA